MHCQWRSISELEQCPDSLKRLQRFLQENRRDTSPSGEIDNDDPLSQSGNARVFVFEKYRDFRSLSNLYDLGCGHFFPAEFCQIDRVISHCGVDGSEAPPLIDLVAGKHWNRCEFLICWQKLGYDEATWEEYTDLIVIGKDLGVTSKVQRYLRFCEPPPIPHPPKKSTGSRRRSARISDAASLASKV